MSQQISFEQTSSVPVNIEVPLTFHHFNAGEGKPLLLFLHGFADSATSFLKRAMPDFPADYEILAPNGPFPNPQLKNDKWRVAFSWYFVDFETGRVLISPKVAAGAVHQLLVRLNLVDRPKIIVGFSQGGFFIPFILPFLKNVKHAISIGAAYRRQDYPDNLDIAVDAIHGEDDQVVKFQRAQETFPTLKDINPHGEFFAVPGLGHKIDDQARAILLRQIRKNF